MKLSKVEKEFFIVCGGILVVIAGVSGIKCAVAMERLIKFNASSPEQQFSAVQGDLVYLYCKDKATGENVSPPLPDMATYQKWRSDPSCVPVFR